MPPVDLPLRCACGALHGQFAALPIPGARGVCYCDDCQAYARWLARAGLLDAHGGTEVVHTWPARVRIEGGALSLLRLSPKGLHRWYAGCCRTPVANSFGSPRAPFCGLLRVAIAADDAQLDALYGKAHGVQGRFAPGGVPPGAHASASFGVIVGAIGILARAAWAGGHAPTPFFTADGAPVATATVLSAEDRARLAVR